MLDEEIILKKVLEEINKNDSVISMPKCLESFDNSVNVTLFILCRALVRVIVTAINEENERIEEAQRRGNSLFDDD